MTPSFYQIYFSVAAKVWLKKTLRVLCLQVFLDFGQGISGAVNSIYHGLVMELRVRDYRMFYVLCRCIVGIKGVLSVCRTSVFSLIYSSLVGSIKSRHKLSKFYILFFVHSVMELLAQFLWGKKQ